MTSVPQGSAAPDAVVAEQPSRVHPKPATPTPGYPEHADGAWWPRTRDLAAGLPALFAALATRLGVIERMTYNLGEWQPVARRLATGATPVRLGGFRHQAANPIDVIGSGNRRVALLVVPPETSDATANKIALATADVRNLERVDSLLARASGPDGDAVTRPRAGVATALVGTPVRHVGREVRAFRLRPEDLDRAAPAAHQPPNYACDTPARTGRGEP